LFAFVRHGVVVPVRIGDDTVAGWTSWLAQVGANGETGASGEASGEAHP
jgi:hypothetical protein